MSGIAGIIHFDAKPVEPGSIEKMTNAMVHRGPDGIHRWLKGSVALGHCMLRTTPESLEEHQPLTNEDGSLVLVMDGRVDNWEELRKDLLGRGAVLRDRSDAELVLRAYEIWGSDCLPQIDGDFALVIWDTPQRKVFCARDRLGNKPFNYHWDGKTLTFASEVRAILALPRVPEVLNEGVLAEFLAAEWYSRNETFWHNVQRIVPAHRMIVDGNGTHVERYWEPDLWTTPAYTSDDDYMERYREIFAHVVRRCSRSQLPVSFEVSGGLDSSAVFGMAEHLRSSGQLLAPGLEGYTLAFQDENSGAYELPYARILAEHLAVPIHETRPSMLPLRWYAEYASTSREFPGFPNASMFIGIRRRAVSRGSRVVLTGEGGDEWLDGSRVYLAEALSKRRWTEISSFLRNDAALFGYGKALYWLLRYGIFPLMPARPKSVLDRAYSKLSPRKRMGDWLAPEMREKIAQRRSDPSFHQVIDAPSVGQRALLERLYDPFSDLVMEQAERLSALTGVELRYPMRSSCFVQYAFSTPESLRLRGNRPKFIHTESLRAVLPRAILERKTKAEFSQSFHVHLDEMEKRLTDTLPLRRPHWLNQAGVKDLYQTYQQQTQSGWPLWPLWSLFGCDELLAK